LGCLEGVVRTRVGYTGGSTRNPTYHDLGDHSETVQLDFDSSVVTFEQLVEVFFASHNAWYGSADRQYMSAIFFHSAGQEQVARQVKAQEEDRAGTALQTEIVPASQFYLAEDYHQKYALQSDSILMYDFRRMYPNLTDIVNSTAAARVNAYLYRCGSLEQLRAELDDLGLSAAGRAHMLEFLGG
jgi:peptide-methionine (S)-S-oxide reductase